MLNIPNHKVSKIVKDTEDRLEFMLEPIKDVRAICSGCGGVHTTPVHSRNYVVIEDLPISGRRVFLYVFNKEDYLSRGQ